MDDADTFVLTTQKLFESFNSSLRVVWENDTKYMIDQEIEI